MVNMSFQILDVLVAAVIVSSTVYAAYRGFANETLSIVAWAAAALATLFVGPWVAGMLKNAVSPPWMGEITGYVAVFLSVFIPISFMSFRLSQNVRKSPVNALDRTLGAAFGVVRGFVILGILYVIFATIVPPTMRPGWITKAYSLPLVKGSAEVLSSLVPEDTGDLGLTAPKPDAGKNTVTAPEPEKPAAEPAPAAAPKHQRHVQKHRKKTYSAEEREALDRKIETLTDGNNGKP